MAKWFCLGHYRSKGADKKTPCPNCCGYIKDGFR